MTMHLSEIATADMQMSCNIFFNPVIAINHHLSSSLFVLMFYGQVNPMGSCRVRSVYLTTRLMGRLSPLSG